MTEYSDKPLPRLSSMAIKDCYICGKRLFGTTNKDHIIPQKLFAVGSGNRPYLLVHETCNTGKSKLDERAAYRILLVSNLDKDAEATLLDFLKLANKEAQDSFRAEVDGHSARNRRLALTLGEGMEKIGEVGTGEDALFKIKMGDGHVDDLNEYAVNMATGLYIRNVKGAVASAPKIRIVDYRLLHSEDKLEQWMSVFNQLRLLARTNEAGFGQSWGTRINYSGLYNGMNISDCIIYIEFFQSLCISATFGNPASSNQTP